MRCRNLGNLGRVAGAGWLAIACLCSCGKTESPKAKSKDAAAPRQVELAAAQTRPMERVIVATGTLAAYERSVLSAKVSGRLQRLTVDVGSVVKKDDLLAQIEPLDYELGLQQASAALAQARAELGLSLADSNDQVALDDVSSVKQAKALQDEAAKNRERVLSLSKSGIASQSELDTVEAAYTVAFTKYEVAREAARSKIATVAQRRAEYELARKRLADASLRAPFDGTVQARPANIGEFVAAGTPTVELVRTDPLRLRLRVPERDARHVAVDQLVRVSIEGDTNCYTGRIARLSPALDEETLMLLVEADVPRAGSLRPGLFVRGQIVIAQNEPALSIPEQCVMTFAGIEKVVLADSGKAVEKVISTGRRQAGWVEILSGLNQGQEAVINPAGLRTGNPLIVGPARETQAGEPAGGGKT